MVRVKNSLLEGKADVLTEFGRFSEANALYSEVTQTVQHLSVADPQDLRALFDLQTGLNQQALGFETAADPAFSASTSDRQRNLAAAEKMLTQEAGILERMLKQDPSNDEYAPVLADAQVRLGTIRSILHSTGDSAAIARTGIASLKSLAAKDQASPTTLDLAAKCLLTIEPESLRDPKAAALFAERAVALSHRKSPSMLWTLAQAYRASGQAEKSRATAREGLALLAPVQPGAAKPRLRKLLEVQAQT
jgi:hypothetical protein